MSKFTQALDRIQKNSGDDGPRYYEKNNTIFITNPVNEKIRSYSDYRRNVSYFRMLRPVLILAVVLTIMLVFFFGVREGMKIKQFLEKTPPEAAGDVEAGQAGPPAAGEEQAGASEQTNPVTAPAGTEETVAGREASSPESGQAVSEASPAGAQLAIPEGKYTIQLIAYGTESRAREETERLTSQGFEAFIIEGGNYHQLGLNRFQTADEARSFLETLRAEGALQRYPGAYVRAIPER